MKSRELSLRPGNLFLVPAILGCFALQIETRAAIEDVRRLYDASPVSATNPVLAEVKECQIEIPVSEFLAFVKNQTPAGSEGKELTPAEKRRELDKLLDEHFWVWEGYDQKADQTQADIRGTLNITRDEAMKTLLMDQDIGPEANTLENYEKLSRELRERIFSKAEIHISTNAYEVLKAAARRVNAADKARAKIAPADAGPTNSPPQDGLSGKERDLPLATCKVATIRVGNLLQPWMELSPAERPDLEKPEVLVKLLQEILGDGLLLAEAKERGLDQADVVRQQVQSDRTGLVREWALGQVTKKTEAAMKAPDIEKQLRKWYETNLTGRYTTRDDNGKEQVTDFKAEHDVIADDYFIHLQEQLRAEELQKLRRGRNIHIDEKLLDKLVVNWWAPVKLVELSPPVAAWDGDTREYVVKPGETNTSFTFTITNLEPVELEIEDISPANEFVTIQSPTLPWKLQPQEHGTLTANVDLRNKRGIGYSPIHVTGSLGNKILTLKLIYPDSSPTTPGEPAPQPPPAPKPSSGQSGKLP